MLASWLPFTFIIAMKPEQKYGVAALWSSAGSGARATSVAALVHLFISLLMKVKVSSMT